MGGEREGEEESERQNREERAIRRGRANQNESVSVRLDVRVHRVPNCCRSAASFASCEREREGAGGRDGGTERRRDGGRGRDRMGEGKWKEGRREGENV